MRPWELFTIYLLWGPYSIGVVDVQSTPSDKDSISPSLPTPHAYHIRVEKRMGSSPTGGPVYGDKVKLAVT